jgi:hypothetical protein
MKLAYGRDGQKKQPHSRVTVHRATRIRTGDPESPRHKNSNIRLVRLHAFSCSISIPEKAMRQDLDAVVFRVYPGVAASKVSITVNTSENRSVFCCLQFGPLTSLAMTELAPYIDLLELIPYRFVERGAECSRCGARSLYLIKQAGQYTKKGNASSPDRTSLYEFTMLPRSNQA